jgi:hypothetical protein
MKYLAIVLITAGAIVGTFFYGQSVGKGQVRAEWIADKLSQNVEARAREHELLDRLNKQEKQQYENEQTHKRIVADSRATIAGLRNVISARAGTDDNPESITQAIATTAQYRSLFSQCTTEYAAMAERADEINLQAHGLLGYVTAVITPAF